MSPKKKHNVVIIGAGFAGIKAALELEHDDRFNITIISSSPHFSFYGTLYKTATGGPKSIARIPLDELFHNKKIKIIHDKAIAVQRQSRTVKTYVGHELHYDALLIGVGAVTNYFGIKGLKKYSYGIKSIDEAEELKEHLHNQLAQDKRLDLNYVVVGGGATGVELAGALPEYIQKIAECHGIKGKHKVHVDLVEASPRLLPQMPKDISWRVTKQLRSIGVKVMTNTAVQAQTADALMVNNKPIMSHTVIWTAGMTNNPFFTNNNFQVTQKGKVRVDQYLQAEPGVYVIGDNADTPYSGMAQTALHDGHFVAANLVRIANGKDPSPYKAKKPIYVVPAGPRWAALLWGRFRLYGRPGWWLRRIADLVAYHDYEPLPNAFNRFLSEDDKEEVCTTCSTAKAK